MKNLSDDSKELTEQQLDLLDKILELLSTAALEAMICRSYRQLQNIIIYTQNLLTDEAIKPTEVYKRESWKYITLIVDCSLKMVEDIKNSKGFADDDDLNVFENKPYNSSYFKIDKLSDKGLTPLDPLEEKKKYWFA